MKALVTLAGGSSLQTETDLTGALFAHGEILTSSKGIQRGKPTYAAVNRLVSEWFVLNKMRKVQELADNLQFSQLLDLVRDTDLPPDGELTIDDHKFTIQPNAFIKRALLKIIPTFAGACLARVCHELCPDNTEVRSSVMAMRAKTRADLLRM